MEPDSIFQSTLNFPTQEEGSNAAPFPKKDLPRYTILFMHAEGGLGRIHVAQDNDLQRQVVLKELKPQSNCCRAQNRFLREAQVTGQLEHPNIVPVYELSQRDDGSPYYIMRYLRGQTFKQAIAEHHRRSKEGKVSSLDLLKLLESFLGVCQAVAYAHSRGVLHRDLKPENVMLGRFGEVILLDWGLAKVLDQAGEEDSMALQLESTPSDASADETMTGEVLGTPAYMAPEQAQGKQELVDFTTDIYGLGAILFEILTGRPPHLGQSTGDVLVKIVTEPTPRPRSYAPHVPPALNAICEKAMAHKQEDRYQLARELSEEVRRYLADEPVQAYPESLLSRMMRWSRRHRSWTLAIAGSLLAIILIATVSSILLARMAESEHTARVNAEHRQEQSLRVSATFAARTVASEIDLRWRILETEASNAQMHRLILSLKDVDKIRDHPAAKRLLSWLEVAFHRHEETAKATSWFLNDASGKQLARWPRASTIGQTYAFRDYFHGRGSDLPRDMKNIAPLREVHRSIVFRSLANGNRMVAFSVPIWSEALENAERRVLGVLGMTVELGRFGSLQIGLGQDQIAVLVDTRPDGIKPVGRSGLILHHPYLAELRKQKVTEEQKRKMEQRLSSDRVETLRRLREKKMRQDLLGKHIECPESWDGNYLDSIGGAYKGRWLAAFEPVLIPGRPSSIKDTGWVVIVQERQ